MKIVFFVLFTCSCGIFLVLEHISAEKEVQNCISEFFCLQTAVNQWQTQTGSFRETGADVSQLQGRALVLQAPAPLCIWLRGERFGSSV